MAEGIEIPCIGMEVQAREQRDGFLVSISFGHEGVVDKLVSQRVNLRGRHVVGDQRGERGGTVVWYTKWMGGQCSQDLVCCCLCIVYF